MIHGAYYYERLSDLSLLEKAVTFETGKGLDIAVPIGGSRRSGYIFLWDSELAISVLPKLDEELFPNIRMTVHPTKTVHIEYGESVDGMNQHDKGIAYGYRPEIVFP